MEIPMLQNFHREYGPRGLKILMIDEDDSLKMMAQFQKAKEMPWTVVHWNYDAMNALGNPGVIPVSYLVDNADNIDKVFVGDADESELRRRIEKLVEKD
jgi:hypothetical protein